MDCSEKPGATLPAGLIFDGKRLAGFNGGRAGGRAIKADMANG
jgi:hypothetical protein